MDQKTVEDFILDLPEVSVDHPFGQEVEVFNIGPKDSDKMFALIAQGKTPVRLSLKCDPVLSQVLRDRYDEVLPGHHLNQKYWNTLILTGQLQWQEVKELIQHSYDLVKSEAI